MAESAMPVSCYCPNERCKYHKVRQAVRVPVFEGTHVVARPTLMCTGCMFMMKILLPKAWR